MAISPPSDLVVDVLKAADPVQHGQAVRKLARLAPPGSAQLAFADTLKGVSDNGFGALFSSSGGVQTSIVGRRIDQGFEAVGRAGESDASSPARKFEAMVLQQFVEVMLPDDAEEVFGEGSTGEIWKSMLAEQLGNQIAASGGVGLASFITDSLKEQKKA
ncbi:rod-binding protein [Roseibium aestuarii]|uniref:Rod-binding protein n=1 Tax=Roseibium aestuarii TaxID=2600299 RepID=A0ABW4JVH0_9HYPH|nr:rod-binding protein [Roseibium aestuarii]